MMELFFIGMIISGFAIWGLSSFAYALLAWGIGIAMIGIGFLIAEENIWDYIAKIVKKFKVSE